MVHENNTSQTILAFILSLVQGHLSLLQGHLSLPPLSLNSGC